MSDRSEALAELFLEHWDHDRDALLCDLISRYPDVSGIEIEEAIETASQRRGAGRLTRVLQSPGDLVQPVA